MRRFSMACLVALLFVPAAGAQESTALVEQIAGVNRSLDRLVGLLEASLANQKIDVLLRRIELKDRRMAPLERRLRGVQDDVAHLQSELVRFETMKERAEDELLEAERDGNEGARNEARYMIDEFEQAIASERAKLEELERRIPLLENELADGRNEIAILDEKLEELLE